MALTEKKEETGIMRISFHGSDRGNAVLQALIMIMALSIIFLSLTLRINAAARYAHEYRERLLKTIQDANREIRERYDLY